MQYIILAFAIFVFWHATHASFRRLDDNYYFRSLLLAVVSSAAGAWMLFYLEPQDVLSFLVLAAPLLFMLLWRCTSRIHFFIFGRWPEPLGPRSKVGDRTVYFGASLEAQDFAHFFAFALILTGAMYAASTVLHT